MTTEVVVFAAVLVLAAFLLWQRRRVLALMRKFDGRHIAGVAFLALGIIAEGPMTAFLALIIALALGLSSVARRPVPPQLAHLSNVVFSLTTWSVTGYLVGRLAAWMMSDA